MHINYHAPAFFELVQVAALRSEVEIQKGGPPANMVTMEIEQLKEQVSIAYVVKTYLLVDEGVEE